jgi:fructose-bisphosphate aldolase class II
MIHLPDRRPCDDISQFEVSVLTSAQLMLNAFKAGVVIPAFNVHYLPMVEPIIRAVVDQAAFALIETARPEWADEPNRTMRGVLQEFERWNDPAHVRLHLDHVPVIDESYQRVDYASIIQQALDLGYPSVMIDGSRLPLEDNIAVTRQIAEMAHRADAACEAELGRVWGHESGPPPSYEDMFTSGRGFTDVDEARRFVQASGCDWLSVAVGSIHGTLTAAFKDQKKVEARLDLDRLEQIRQATNVPLVLHGGSSVRQEYILGGVRCGIAKINIATEIRQAYEAGLKQSSSAARDAVYERTCWVLRDYLEVAGSQKLVMGYKIT